MLLLQDDASIQIQDLVANMAFKIITKGNSVVTSWYACNACNVLAGSCGLKIALLPLANVKKNPGRSPQAYTWFQQNEIC